MAASQDPGDNPVAINVVPMVDVIFCLCVFFMCSFQFKQVEGRLDSWLPRDKGMRQDAVAPATLDEIRVALEWDAERGTAIRRLGDRVYSGDLELEDAVRAAHADWRATGRSAPVIIDGSTRCPWHAVVRVLNSVRRLGIHDVQLAMAPAPGPR
jgi:biopolymer transport protein ExbD